MKIFYLSPAFATLFLTLLFTSVRAQTTLASQSFEGAGTWAFTPTPGTYNVSSDVWGAVTSIGAINPSDGASLWGMRDLNNPNGGGNFDHVLAFNTVNVSGETALQLSFEWNVQSLNAAGDVVSYEYFLDGIGQGVVILAEPEPEVINTGWVTETVTIPDGTVNVALNLIGSFDGDSDIAAYDHVLLTANNPADPCGITSFGPAATNCTSSTNGADNDTYAVSIPFTGSDADASLVVEVGGSAVAFTIASGDLAAGTGPLVIQSPAFLEGTSFSIGLTDGGGDCATGSPATGSVTSNACNPRCDVSILTENVTFFCESLTDGTDNVTIDIDYSGNDDGVNVTVTGAVNGVVFSGMDLFNDPDGRAQATGIPEGDAYTVVVSGSGCDRMFTLPIPEGVCAGSDIIINEVLYDGITPTDQADLGVPVFGDPNRDDVFSGGEDEFVEITNIGAGTIDIGGYTLSDQNNADIITVPAGTMLASGEYFVFFGGGSPDLPCGTVTREAQSPGSAFLGLSNNGPEQVIIKDGTGTVVAQMSYDGTGNVNESLALSPNADPNGTFVTQTSILDPTRYSPCFDNDDANLPVELLAFTADAQAKYILLKWETVNEIANDRFAVERSANGRVWEGIGSVMASASGGGLYRFKDENPLNGHNLYRLRQYDLDGAFALYGPVMAEFSGEAGIYPNPVRHELNLRGFNPNSRISLLDASGKVLRELPTGAFRTNVANLRPGLYILRISEGDGTEVMRFVKQ